MKKMLIAMLLLASSAAVVVADAEAKRLGSGGSVGRQSPAAARQAPAQPMQQQQAARPATPAAAAPAAAAKPASPWRGMLGGALLGLGLGALLSHLGLGGAMAGMISTILMVALIAMAGFFIYRFLTRNKNGNGAQTPAYAGGYGGAMGGSTTPEIGSRLEPAAQPAAFQADQPRAGSAFEPAGAAPAAAAAAVGATPYGVPADFDVPAFLRHAKTYFIRLQAAWDKADVNDLREFTTPEMFAELKLQIQERGPSPNVTDVVSVNADLLGIEQQGNDHIASVRFEGLIRENPNANTEPFSEIWNLVKPVNGAGGWVLAGIQQLA
jgi:predicted lipid-binding transport protein (Tim44 family)